MKLYKKLLLEALVFKKWCYFVAFLIISIPICIMLFSNTIFSHTFATVIISISIIFIIIGKFLTAYSRIKGDKKVQTDIAFIIAFLIILLFNVFKR